MEAEIGYAATHIIGKPHCLEDVETMALYILGGSDYGSAAAGMFKLNIQIINNQDGRLRFIVSSSSAAEEEEKEEELLLKPVGTFFEQTDESRLGMIGHCCFRDSPEKVYMFPNDTKVSIDKRNTASSSPLVFDCKADTTINNLFSMPAAPKWDPIAAAIGDKIYLFSTGSLDHSPDPMFESYYPPLDKWSVLPSSDCHGFFVIGYVVLNDKFLVICFDTGRFAEPDVFLSYNTVSGEWKPVDNQIPKDCDIEEEKIYAILFGQSVVLFESSNDGIIYSYECRGPGLHALSYTVNPEGGIHDISLGLTSHVEGFYPLFPRCERFYSEYDSDNSGAVAKLSYQNRNNILCVLHGFPYGALDAPELNDNDYWSCSVLKTFPFNIFFGDPLHSGKILSCFFV